MEEKYLTKRLILLKYLFIFCAAFSMLSQPVMAQIVIPFSQRTSKHSQDRKIYSIRGDFTLIGNTNLTLEDYDDYTNNSYNQMKYVDVDGDPRTLNSSSATLELSTENGANPDCSNIIYAGLYWTGRSVSGNEPFSVTQVPGEGGEETTVTFDKRRVKIKGPNQAEYTELLASSNSIYFPDAGQHEDMFVGFVEVTDYVQKYGLGEYTVADIAIQESLSDEAGYFGGWSMLVIYENSQMNWRDITSFDGFAFVEMNVVEDFELPVSGFKAIEHGPVSVKLGIMVGEGDVNDFGDFLEIRSQDDTEWIPLSHELNSEYNFFNSSILTGNNPRNPNLRNNTGIDISMFSIPNQDNEIIGNGQTETRFRYGSAIDTYVIYNITFAVDAYVPGIAPSNTILRIDGKEVSGPEYSVQPGQEIEYQLELRNTGTEAIADVDVVIPLPDRVSYVESTAFFRDGGAAPAQQPSFDPSIGSNGAIVWKAGDLPMSGSETEEAFSRIVYTVKTSTDCADLSLEAGDTLVVNGKVNGVGVTSRTEIVDQGFIFGFNLSGSCTGEPILTPTQVRFDLENYLAANCLIPPIAKDDQLVSEDGEPVVSNLLDNDTAGSSPIVSQQTRLIDPESGAQAGELDISGRGKFQLDDKGNLSFYPEAGFSGMQRLNYIIFDQNGQADTAEIVALSAYRLPVAKDDSIFSEGGVPVRMNILENDSGGSRPLSSDRTRLIDPETAEQVLSLRIAGKGNYELDSSGELLFTPEAGYAGDHSIAYVIFDQSGQSSTAHIHIRVTYVDPAAQDDYLTSKDGQAVALNLLENDTPGSTPIVPERTRLIDPETGEFVQKLDIPGVGSYELDGQGQLIFAPEPGFQGEHTVAYVLYDSTGKSAKANIYIKSSYGPPVASDDFLEAESGTVTVPVLANDQAGSAALDPGSVALIDPVTKQEIDMLTIPGKGVLEVRPDGTIRFTPERDFQGELTFSYSVRDVNGVISNVAEVTILIHLSPEDQVRIPNVFTPNGDGRNDTFVIEHSDGFKLDLSVFNRWGAEVYRNNNYQNNWDGGNLNEGTYYYQVILIKDGKQTVRKGWVLLKR